MRTLVTIGVLLLAATAAPGQCRNGSCRQGGCQPSFQPNSFTPTAVGASGTRWEWRTIAEDPDGLYLFQNGVQVGGFNTADGYYRPFDGTTWGPKGGLDAGRAAARYDARAQDPEVQQNGQGNDPYPGGVDKSRVGRQERYRCRDHEYLSKTQAVQMIQGAVPPYNERQTFTVIGTPQQTAQVVADATTPGNALSQWASERDVIVQAFAPDDWQVRPGSGFDHDGSPTIYWLDRPGADGHAKVLFHGHSYQGPEKMASFLRQPAPNRNPDADPNEQSTGPSVGVDWQAVRPLLIPGGIVAAGALILTMRRRVK